MLAGPALEKPSKVPNKHDIKVRRAHLLEDSFRSNVMNNVRNVDVLKTKVIRLLRETHLCKSFVQVYFKRWLLSLNSCGSSLTVRWVLTTVGWLANGSNFCQR